MTTVRRQDGVHNQTTPAREWTIAIPEGRTNLELIGVFSSDGRSAIQYDSSDFIDGVLTVYFGVDAVAGVARYEYDTESSGSTTTVQSDGGIINVTVHQYNGGLSSQS